MKRILTLVTLITLLFGCSQKDDSPLTQNETRQVREQVTELIRKTEELRTLVESQAQKMNKLEDRLAIVESTELENDEKEITSSVPLDTNHPTGGPEVVYYQKNEEIKLKNLTISSPEGRMVSDAEQAILGGDLKIVLPIGTLFANDAILEKKDDAIELTVKTLRFEKQ